MTTKYLLDKSDMKPTDYLNKKAIHKQTGFRGVICHVSTDRSNKSTLTITNEWKGSDGWVHCDMIRALPEDIDILLD